MSFLSIILIDLQGFKGLCARSILAAPPLGREVGCEALSAKRSQRCCRGTGFDKNNIFSEIRISDDTLLKNFQMTLKMTKLQISVQVYTFFRTKKSPPKNQQLN